MGTGQKVVKWLMLVFNLVFWVSGIGLIIAGAVAQTIYKPYLSFLDGTYISAPVLLIVVGAVITIIAFFGCCGSAKENYCMLITFAVLLGIIFCVELAGGIAGYVERGRVSSYLEKNMHKSIHQFNVTTDKQVWDQTQHDLECCGAASYQDWLRETNTTAFNGTVPGSCCREGNECVRRRDVLTRDCVGETTACPIWTKGCANLLKDTLETSIGVIGGVGIGVAFIQIIGIVFACFLARRVKRGYTYA